MVGSITTVKPVSSIPGGQGLDISSASFGATSSSTLEKTLDGARSAPKLPSAPSPGTAEEPIQVSFSPATDLIEQFRKNVKSDVPSNLATAPASAVFSAGNTTALSPGTDSVTFEFRKDLDISKAAEEFKDSIRDIALTYKWLYDNGGPAFKAGPTKPPPTPAELFQNSAATFSVSSSTKLTAFNTIGMFNRGLSSYQYSAPSVSKPFATEIIVQQDPIGEGRVIKNPINEVAAALQTFAAEVSKKEEKKRVDALIKEAEKPGFFDSEQTKLLRTNPNLTSFEIAGIVGPEIGPFHTTPSKLSDPQSHALLVAAEEKVNRQKKSGQVATPLKPSESKGLGTPASERPFISTSRIS